MSRQSHARLLALAALLAASTWCRADDPPKQWAVLVGVKKHDMADYNKLHFPVNDVVLMESTLQKRAAVPTDQILRMTDDSLAERKPTLDNLRRELPLFLKKAGKEDRVIIFFSGHGVLVDGYTYLVPSNFDLKNAAKTGLPTDEVRQMLKDCPARVKFLILDCCHAAGSGKGVEGISPSEAVAKALVPEKADDCVLLASCRGDEKSWEWEENKQGVFTYWLARALEGAAVNDDGQITITKVNEYVEKHVRETTEQLPESPVQTPLLIGKLQGSPVVLELRPEHPKTLCRRLGEHINLELRQRKLKKVGVLEFQEVRRGVERLTTATLQASCTEQVRLSLKSLADAGGYEVVDAKDMKEAVKDLELEAIGRPGVMQQLRERASGLDAIVTGGLRRRGDTIHLECELMSVPGYKTLVETGGLLPLNASLIGDLGDSFDIRRGPHGDPYSPRVLKYTEEQTDKPHPLLDKDWPYLVELYTVDVKDGEEITDHTPRRKKAFVKSPAVDGQDDKKKRAQLLVGAREGEIFEIHVTNKSKERVAMVLLVDGFDTLGQEPKLLGTGRAWVLDKGEEYAVPGWTFPAVKPGDRDVIKTFKFVDVTKSVAGRRHFGESIGLITAAFYAEGVPGTRGPAVGEGPEVIVKLEKTKFIIGNLLGVVQIRYVDEKDLPKK